MKEKEFLEKVTRLNRVYLIAMEIPISYSLNEDKEVLIDEDSIRESFEKELKEVLNDAKLV